MKTRTGITIVVLLLAMATPGVALATDCSGNSAVSQYQECPPTGGGGVLPGLGKQTKTPLLAKATRALNQVQNPQVKNALGTISTSSYYGAPAKLATPARQLTHRSGKKNRKPEGPVTTASPSFPSSLGAAIT